MVAREERSFISLTGGRDLGPAETTNPCSTTLARVSNTSHSPNWGNVLMASGCAAVNRPLGFLLFPERFLVNVDSSGRGSHPYPR